MNEQRHQRHENKLYAQGALAEVRGGLGQSRMLKAHG